MLKLFLGSDGIDQTAGPSNTDFLDGFRSPPISLFYAITTSPISALNDHEILVRAVGVERHSTILLVASRAPATQGQPCMLTDTDFILAIELKYLEERKKVVVPKSLALRW